MRKPLTTFRIVLENLRYKSGRTTALVFIVSLMAFSLFGGVIISQSLDNGLQSLETRLGADIAVVPQGSEDSYENAFLGGSPVSFYFSHEIANQISALPKVEQVTSQFYLASLFAAECCSEEVQIIGIDFDTDFVVTPWISQIHSDRIGPDEVIVGSKITTGLGENIIFFNQVLRVAGRLDRTATGLDTTVYMNIDTARNIAKEAQASGHFFVDVDLDDAVSTILLNIESDYNPHVMAANIRMGVPGVDTIVSQGIYSSFSQSLSFINLTIGFITIALAILAALVLLLLFSLIANSRKKEFAILRVIGATRRKLVGIVISEAFIISLSGAVIGCIFAAIIVFPFGQLIGTQVGMPLLLPDFSRTVLYFVVALVLSALTGPVSAAYSAYIVSRAETYATLREGE